MVPVQELHRIHVILIFKCFIMEKSECVRIVDWLGVSKFFEFISV